ncbi:MAG: ATP-dependent RecD-like DNA helicase [Candidatus Aenigmarchaeota archaeon]|nr:ATP-dependent RecD-like DNA helicase [Candidatus Aenigmarchaeota archaeon]
MLAQSTDLKRCSFSGYISFAKKWSGYLVFRVENKWVYVKNLSLELYPLMFVGSLVSVKDAVEVLKREKKGYLVEDIEFLEKKKFDDWRDEVLDFLKKSGRRSAVKFLLRKKGLTVDNIYDLYLKDKIDFYNFFACVFSSGFIRVGSVVIQAAIKHFSNEFYNEYKGKRSELSLFVRFLRSFFSSVGVKLSEDEIKANILQSPHVILSTEGGKQIVYPREIALKRQYCISRIKEGNKSGFTLCKTLEDALSQFRYVALVGGPGTGKTTIIKDYLRKTDRFVQLTATTGKAAQNLPNGRTIHKWLGYNGKEYTSEDTYCDVLVIDESSMLTWGLLYEVLSRPHSKVVFVGDPEQLPPVHGESVFNTLLGFMPTVVLSKVFRGKMDVTYEGFKDIDYAYSKLKMLVKDLLRVKAKWQVLSPVYEGPLGIDKINELLDNYFLDFGVSEKRVYVKSNIYDSYGRLVVVNGATGYLLGFSGEKAIVRLDDGRQVEVPKKSIGKGYCLSVYKAQGSEWDYVVLFIPKGYPKTKEFIKTATTRGKEVTFVLEHVD